MNEERSVEPFHSPYWQCPLSRASNASAGGRIGRGGPRVVPPKHTSFGTTLLQLSIGDGETSPDIDCAPEGFSYSFEAPPAAVAASGS
jgi:hypothetical protein